MYSTTTTKKSALPYKPIAYFIKRIGIGVEGSESRVLNQKIWEVSLKPCP
jgi:hypothetical protein